MGKGRSPTGPAEAAGPHRSPEVRAVGSAQDELRAQGCLTRGSSWGKKGTERPLRTLPGRAPLDQSEPFGGPRAFRET